MQVCSVFNITGSHNEIITIAGFGRGGAESYVYNK